MTWLLGDLLARMRPLPRPAPAAPTPRPSRLGLAALEIAEHEIGRGEEGGNNAGPDIDRYRRDLIGRPGPAGPWCAAFVSWCVEQGWILLGRPGGTCPVRRSHNARELWRRCAAAGQVVTSPLPGDIGLWSRGAADARTGHIAIVRHPVVDGLWTSLDGNRGLYPSKVRPYPHELGEAGFLGWARLLP